MSVLDFSRNSKQKGFVFSASRRCAYAGAIRSGKTVGACARVLLHAQVFPGSRTLVSRRHFTDLKGTTLKELFRLVAEMNGGNHAVPGPFVKRFIGDPAGYTLILNTSGEPSEIICRPAKDVSKQLGLELSSYFFDQAEELDEDVFQHVRSRLSWWNAERRRKFDARYGYMPRSFETLTCNPDPGWLRDFLFPQGSPNPDWELFETNIEDNRKNLGPKFIEELRSSHPPDWCERFMDGSWEIRGGSVYQEFNPEVHVCEPFQIPAFWSKFLACDWGISAGHRCVVLWGVVSPEGRMYIIKELSVTDLLVSQVSERVHAMTPKWWPREPDGGLTGVIDPSTNQRHGTGRTVRDEFGVHKIYWRNADNHVLAGVNKVAEYLHPNNDGIPGLQIFREACPNLIRSLKRYIWEPPNSNGISSGKPMKKDDDEADCLRYLALDVLEQRGGIMPKSRTVSTFDDFIMASQFGGK